MEKSKMNKPSIFGAEESSDSDDGGDWVKKAMMTKKETKLKATTKNEMAAALEEDPTVFQYDEVYDQLEKRKEERGREREKEGDSSEEEVEEVKGQAEDDSKKAKTYADMLEEEEIRSPVR